MRYVSTEEAAIMLGVSRRRVQQMIQRNQLRARRDGRTWKVRPVILLRFRERKRPVGRPRKH